MRRTFAVCTLICLAGAIPAAGQVTTAATFSAPQCQAPGIGNVVLTAPNAPAPSFQGKFDIFLVVDESGSIDAQEFAQLKSLILDFANSLTFGDAASRLGVVMFSSEARLFQGLTASKTAFLNVLNNNFSQVPGGTCTGCGMALAISQLQTFKRPDAEAVIVTITDGQANVFTQTIESAAAAADTLGYIRLAVGIGGNLNLNELDLIASDIPDRQTVWVLNTFASLTNFASTLLTGLFGSPETPPAALDVVVNLVVNPSVTLLGATSGLGVVARNGNEITWTIPALPYGTSSLSFTAAAPVGPAASGLTLFSTATYQAGSSGIVQIQSPIFDLPACAEPEPDPDIDELLAQLEICQANNQQLADDLATANARITTLEGEAAALESQKSALQAQVSALQSQVSAFESQVAALQAQIVGLQSELAAAQAALAASEGDAQTKAAAINAAVAAIQQDIRQTFNVPDFVIPGATPEERLQNLISAIAALNKGRLEGIFKALTGQ